MHYAQLHTLTNFSFLRGASHPHELVAQAKALNYAAVAITDECSLAGIVKAYIESEKQHIKLIVGSEFYLSNGSHIIAIAPDRRAYAELSGFITLARQRSNKGNYEAHIEDLRFRLQSCLLIYVAEGNTQQHAACIHFLRKGFKRRLWIGIKHQLHGNEQHHYQQWQTLAQAQQLPLVACDQALMHTKERKPLQDTLTAIRHNTSIDQLGSTLESNSEAYLKPQPLIFDVYPETLIEETLNICRLCEFSMAELRYQYPQEVVPTGTTPIRYLTKLVQQGANTRWPNGTPTDAQRLIEKELSLIEEMRYEYYFLTVYDIVCFAKSQEILYQGRGSAANSVVCYCLHITEISPGQINTLFERFISKERNEPPDIDVDFEHQRREEVIQYIYQKYSRQRAALAASVVTYRPRSAIRDVGKALGLEPQLIDHLAKSLAWWDRTGDLMKRIEEAGLHHNQNTLQHFFTLVDDILGFPRHLSQHVGGFVITQDKTSDLVPIENASMPERTVIQWDKEDLEAMGLMKVDVLALGMLTALRKALAYVHTYCPTIKHLCDIPKEDPDTYRMLSSGDSLGVFQVESRAQMSMLPRLKPKKFYDLVIQIAIVRPGPIQGDMVHPYLRRRDGIEPVTYQNDALKKVLEPTLGVPIFQEQAIRLAMVAAGFSGGQADQLRRAMASWGKNGNLLTFENSFIEGMLANGYDDDFAHRLFSQIKGFGGYGFPESHSASFALLCYFSSWLKCHHPAAFYCALLNSQPMGFYSASQLMQDARRHGITFTPIDVNHSDYDNTLEQRPHSSGKEASDWGIRLGLCRIKSLDSDMANNIVHTRGKTPFTSLHDFVSRTHIHHSEVQTLAAADALHSLLGNRYESHWQASALKTFDKQLSNKEPTQDDLLSTTPPLLIDNIAQDIATTNLSLRTHPMSLLRSHPTLRHCKTSNDLIKIEHGRFVHIAGLVTGRQRPGTAKGTVFLTLEDETGNTNVIVWKRTQTLFRQALLSAQLLSVKGNVEKNGLVTHVVAGKLEDCSHLLGEVKQRSRDFH